MSIPASYIAEVTPRVISAGGSGLEINGLFLTENELLPVGAVASFASASAVGAYFGTESHEYSAAAVYFAGYNNSFKKPSALNFARRVSAPASAFLRGAKFAGTLDSLKTIDDGGFKITVDGSAASVIDVDLTSATSFSDAAAKIQTALTLVSAGAKVSYSSLTGSFQINSGSTGENSAVSFASAPASGGDLSALLNLTEVSGAIISAGSGSQAGGNDIVIALPYEAISEHSGYSVMLRPPTGSTGTPYAYVVAQTSTSVTFHTSLFSASEPIHYHIDLRFKGDIGVYPPIPVNLRGSVVDTTGTVSWQSGTD